MPKLIGADYERRLDAMLNSFEQNPPRKNESRPQGAGSRPPIRAILLEDLVSGGKADAAVTMLQESPEIQQVSITGTHVSGGTFKLTFKSQTTTPISFNASPDDVQAALEALSTIGKGNVKVTLGNQAYKNSDTPDEKPRTEFPGVWLVQFIGAFIDTEDPPDIPLMTGQSSLSSDIYGTTVVDATTTWIDTGIVETLNALIPVGDPTPMRAGAVALAIWFPGVGFAVTACECREFSVTYY